LNKVVWEFISAFEDFIDFYMCLFLMIIDVFWDVNCTSNQTTDIDLGLYSVLLTKNMMYYDVYLNNATFTETCNFQLRVRYKLTISASNT
jgi:hypothetical protein